MFPHETRLNSCPRGRRDYLFRVGRSSTCGYPIVYNPRVLCLKAIAGVLLRKVIHVIWGQLSVWPVLPATAMALWQYASAIHGRVSACAVAASLDIEGVSIPLRIR